MKLYSRHRITAPRIICLLMLGGVQIAIIQPFEADADQMFVPPPPSTASSYNNASSAIDYRQSNGVYQGTSNNLGRFGNNSANSSAPFDNTFNLKQRVSDAEQQLNGYCQIDLNSASALKARGMVLYGMGDIVGANADFNKALSISPNDQQAGEALLDLWRRQVASNPQSVNGHLGLARAYLRTGDLESAQSEYREVVRLDPDNPQLPAARTYVRAALAKQASLKSLATAKALGSAGALPDAYAKTSEALSYDPNSTQVLLYRGQLAEKMHDYAKARQAYISVLEADPKNTAAVKALRDLQKTSPLNSPASVARLTHPVNSAPIHNQPYKTQKFVSSQVNTPVLPQANQQALPQVTPQAMSQVTPQAMSQVAPQPTPRLAPQTTPFVASTSSLANGATLGGIVGTTALPAADEVGTLSNFAGSVRNLAIAQKSQTNGLEQATQASLKSLTPVPTQAPAGLPATGQLRPEVPNLDNPPLISQSPTMASGWRPVPANQVPALTPLLPPGMTVASVLPPAPGFQPSRPTYAGVSLVLDKVSVSRSTVTLKVRLGNDSATALKLPKDLKATARTPGKPEDYAKAHFDGNSVPAKGAIKGVIQLPQSAFSATTDVYLTNLLPQSEACVHLTFPLTDP